MGNNWFHTLKNKIFASRLSVMLAVMVIFSSILLVRLFVLQIVRGQDYQNNYDLRIEKKRSIDATRGNIYDRNGKLLAYNALSYSVTIEDSGTYSATEEHSAAEVKNISINRELSDVITALEANGDAIDNDFGIYIDGSGNYQFSSTGTALQRFRADIYGHASTDDLAYNSRLGYDEAQASADQIMDYLTGDRRFQISDEYDKALAYKIAVIRYEMSLNSYQKYIATTIASNVSDETVAYVKENADTLTGVDIAESSIRKYDEAEAFSSILGYVGTISSDEYEELSATNDTVTLQDKVGKAGLEQYMNSYLMGTKGSETVYVDNVGTPLLTTNHIDPISGNDVYLSIDKDLQVRTYHLLEQELAGILSARLANTKEANDVVGTTESYDVVPVYDAYIALVNNHLIDSGQLKSDDATDLEKTVEAAFENHQNAAISQISSYLNDASAPKYSDLPEEYQKYGTYIVRKLKSDGIFDASAIDADDATQSQWTSEELSVNDYLRYALEQNWIDVSSIESTSKYLDTDEAYSVLVTYITSSLAGDSSFNEIVWRYAILQDEITGGQLCAILYDQGVLSSDDGTRDALASGALSAYSFMKSKIESLEITPGELALDPCSASSIVLDSTTGEVLACVSYPGYDSNRLSDASDSSYYAYLNTNASRPLYNYATQQRTAPGSTFKPMTATAGLSEGVLNTTETIFDGGIFTKVSNHPRCWIYPGSHGSINVSGAIRDSCNYFFYEVGYRLASEGGSYNDASGIQKLQEYASAYGLDQKTGLEIEENTSQIATEYPVMAAIGQSDNNITTAALARYAAAVANSGTVYGLTLLDHVADKNGNVIESYAPSVVNQIDTLNADQWNAIHNGMRMVVESMSTFDGFSVAMAGKTGTAQSSTNRASHALFIGYAPYDNPQITVATRIPYGYSSHYAADVSKNIVGAYFGDAASIALADEGTAASVNNSDVSD